MKSKKKKERHKFYLPSENFTKFTTSTSFPVYLLQFANLQGIPTLSANTCIQAKTNKKINTKPKKVRHELKFLQHFLIKFGEVQKQH